MTLHRPVWGHKTILARLGSAGITVFMVFACTRAMVRALPGDPLETIVAESGTSLPLSVIRSELGLDRPFLTSLLGDARRTIRGDFGVSLLSRRSIAEILWIRFKKTSELTVISFGAGLFFSLLLGISSGSQYRAGGAGGKTGLWLDRFCSFYSACVTALPTPWIGPMLIILFSVWIPLFPATHHIALPALTLSLCFTGFWARLVRERVRESLTRGTSAAAARARGVPEWKVAIKYGFAPASGALAAYFGTQFGSLFAGAFVTEVIFNWPGMGALLVESVLRRDYPVVEAATFVGASTCVLGTLVGDWIQGFIDPRIPES